MIAEISAGLDATLIVGRGMLPWLVTAQPSDSNATGV
jgi:hypothetical protein